MDRPPPPGVLDAFGATTPPEPLPGGQHRAWRSGDVVLKPLDVPGDELRWRAAVLADLDGAAGRVLHQHLARLPRPAFLDGRDHPWAVADRVAWGEQDVDDDGGHLPHVRTLLEARQPVAQPAQLVHGDLTDNVHLHPELAPLVLDLTPYWRPPSYATAIVVADAVVFRGAGLDLLERVRTEECADFPQLLVRALLFRAVADHLLAPDKDEQWPDWFGPVSRYVAGIVRD
ncbi:hypothetical protein [Georgenia sp. Marseille-Q6866]